jgi:hypothetical protein
VEGHQAAEAAGQHPAAFSGYVTAAVAGRFQMESARPPARQNDHGERVFIFVSLQNAMHSCKFAFTITALPCNRITEQFLIERIAINLCLVRLIGLSSVLLRG